MENEKPYSCKGNITCTLVLQTTFYCWMCDVNDAMLINDNKLCHLLEGDETQDMQDILY